MFLRPFSALGLMVLLSACVSASPDQIVIDNDGGGRFSGNAGMGWTEQELRKMVAGQVCGGAAPQRFDLRVISDNWLFSGTC